MNAAHGLPRLLRGVQDGGTLTLAGHLASTARCRRRGATPAQLLDLVERSGLRGRGGAHVSTALKLRAVAGRRRRAIVVANGSESEPASRKDARPARPRPASGHRRRRRGGRRRSAPTRPSSTSSRPSERAWASLAAAVAERGARAAGNRRCGWSPRHRATSAARRRRVIAHLNGGPALPTTVPPRPFERGVRGRPTLVCNVETLAHLALIARHGADWFRALGSASQPGTGLVTLGGAVAEPGVYEIAFGSPLADVLRRAGGLTERPQALLVGGYGGTWLDAQHMGDLTLSEGDPLLSAGSIGAGVLWVLGAGTCGVQESARVLDYLAAESAGQCGPCVFGLRAIADSFHLLARGTAGARRADAAAALGSRRHRPRSLPPPRRRRPLPRAAR